MVAAMTQTLKAACIQLNNGPDRDVNTATAIEFIRQAAAQGAELICTPEYTCQMVEPGKTSRFEGAQTEEDNDQLKQYRALAKELNVWLLIGSLGIKIEDKKLANRSFLIDNEGNIAARYDKIHLFDADLPDGKSFRESNVVKPGDKAVVADTPWGGLGMSICFDVRFAEQYRKMAQAGASILTVPAAYSIPTGSTTWEIFLRTRAAETGSFVIAPAQAGVHEGQRRTWGHSMIIDPLGKVLAESDGQTPGIITAELDLDAVTRARHNVPALYADRQFTVESQVEKHTASRPEGTSGPTFGM